MKVTSLEAIFDILLIYGMSILSEALGEEQTLQEVTNKVLEEFLQILDGEVRQEISCHCLPVSFWGIKGLFRVWISSLWWPRVWRNFSFTKGSMPPRSSPV